MQGLLSAVRAAAVLACTTLVVSLPPALPAAAAPSPTVLADELFRRLTDERRARGLAPLSRDGQLDALSLQWSQQMSRTGQYRHSDKDAVLSDPAYGSRWSGLADNIYKINPHNASAGYAHRGWMRSDGHRLNMLNRGYDAVGIGVYCAEDGLMWATQTFGRLRGSTRPPYDRSAPPAAPIVHDRADGPTCAEQDPDRVVWGGGARMTVTAVGHDSLAVEWSAHRGRPTQYRVVVNGRVAGSSSARRFTAVGLQPRTEHRIAVVALDKDGQAHPGPEVAEVTYPPPRTEPAGLQYGRVSGEGRVETAVETSRLAFPRGAPAAVIARADDFADALSGAALAGTVGGPILLTDRDAVPAATLAEVRRLEVRTVYVLGGTGAVAEAAVRRLPGRVVRLAGRGRAETAVRVADEIRALTGRPLTSAYLADGRRGWPDAVSVSALAAWTSTPLLLSDGAVLPAATAAALRRHEIREVTIVGGPAAVPATVATAVSAAGARVDRVAGADRYDTGQHLRSRALAAGMDAGGVWVATLRNWPDALVVGPAAAAVGQVPVTVSGGHPAREPSDAFEFLAGRGRDLRSMTVTGGEGAVGAAWTWEAFDQIARAQRKGCVLSLCPR
jgi:uncharacterized protein YkwD